MGNTEILSVVVYHVIKFLNVGMGLPLRTILLVVLGTSHVLLS